MFILVYKNQTDVIQIFILGNETLLMPVPVAARPKA
jgi:hypothetical protein